MGGQQLSGPRGGRIERASNGLFAGPIQWALCPPGPAGGGAAIKQRQSWSAGAAGLRPGSVVARIHFEYDRAHLDADDRRALGELAKAVKADMRETGGVAVLLVIGNTDHRGTPGYNMRLGARRALEVHGFVAKALPGAVVYRARTAGELKAAQPGVCGSVPEGQMADDRRVDVKFQRITVIKGDDEVVTIPKLSDVVGDSIRIVKAAATKYPNQAERLLCMLPKLKDAPTTRNDSYWHFQDFEFCWRPSYGPSGFDPRRAERALRERRRSARRFLLRSVAVETDAALRLKRLLYLDEQIFLSWMQTGKKLAVLAGSSDERLFPYWMAIRATLRSMWEDRRTLYSCVVPR